MSAFRWKRILVASAPLLFGPAVAGAAEWVNFYPITGEIALSTEGRWTDFDNGESNQTTGFEERMRLRLGGYSLDPQIFRFDVSLEPALEQEKADSGAESVRSDTSYLDYGARFSALHGVPASPVTLKGDFNRSTTETDGNFGSRSESVIENRGGELHWKFSPFRSTLRYNEAFLDESFTSGFGQPVVPREQFERTLSFRGTSSHMQLYLDHSEFDDRTSANNDYDSDRARLNNNFSWGKNSGLASRLEYLDREGFSAEKRISVVESLHLQHKTNLSTNYEYNYEASERTVDSEIHTGRFGLNHRLYSNLDTIFLLEGSTTDSDQVQGKTFNGSLDFNYAKQIRPGVRFSANLGGGYGVTDNTGGRLDFSESLVVPLSGIVVLAQRFIVLTSIVVTAPGCAPCVEGPGADYEVQDAGGDFTQLFIPATSRINIGDTLDIDYSYDSPTAEFTRFPYRVGFRLEVRSFAFYHKTVGENQDFVSGPDPTTINDRRTDTTGMSWNWYRGRNQVSLGAERVFTEASDRSDTEYILHQSMTYGLASNATLNLRLGQSFVRDTTNVDNYNGDLSVRWQPYRNLSIGPRISAFRRVTDPGSDESFVEAGVDISWNWRRLASKFSYDHTERSSDGFGSIEDRVFFEISRKF